MRMKTDALVEILKSEFERKRKRNASYSLRSFSRDLEIDASNLSKILSYQKDPGPVLKARLAIKIGLSNEDLATFSAMSGSTQDQAYAPHPLETFQLISDWQHYAILELFKLKKFEVSIVSISEKLAIPQKEAKRSLDRLVRAGFLKSQNGVLSLTDTSSTSLTGVATSKAHREHQKQILEGAVSALDHIPIEIRSQSSMTFAIDTQKLELAKALIKKFRRQMGRLLSESENLNEVYQLSVSLYPVTNTKTKENFK
jgi:uncharacterized protein (TIGR02147 family)